MRRNTIRYTSEALPNKTRANSLEYKSNYYQKLGLINKIGWLKNKMDFVP